MGGQIKWVEESFEIELNKNLKGDDFTTLVFHELCHVEQWAKFLLADFNKKIIVRWKGHIYENYSYTKYYGKDRRIENFVVIGKSIRKTTKIKY